jgi:GNAT superfamily N-acetyltransferase
MTFMPEELKIIRAEEKDIPTILFFIKKIAEYEKLSGEVTATEEILKNSLFGTNKFAEVLLAYYDEKPVGYAVYFYNFSTFTGKPGLYLEDIFVLPEIRGKKIGKALFEYLIKIAKEKECGRFEWSVLNWNKPAIEFYKSFGAVPMDGWTVFRLDKQTLDKL